MKIKTIAKQLLPLVIFDFGKKIYQPYKKRVVNRRLYYKLRNLIASLPEIQELFPEEEMKKHYAYEPMRQTQDHPDLFINQIRHYRLYKFFLNNYPQIFNNKTSVVDIGDTSGIIFRAMKRKGLSVNINTEVVEFIRQNGIEAEVGDIENLPFKDKSFEYTFCFECMEHVLNPIRTLKELSRVTQKKIFLSIPYVEQTVIYSLDYWRKLKSQNIKKGGWSESFVKDVDCHKFEFSTEDFKKILTFSFLKYYDNFPINYFEPLGLSHENKGSYFNFFILEPD